ncbi:MAG: hypothetical protein NTX88_05760 [Candidatus Atribacteria bacterium]|nr:hypothetical protein [Candidatus Atribacteria bacterium]
MTLNGVILGKFNLFKEEILMSFITSHKGITILLLIFTVGLFLNLLFYWIIPAAKAQSAVKVGEEKTVMPLSAGGAPKFNPGIYGGYWTIYAVVREDGKVGIGYYEIAMPTGGGKAVVYHSISWETWDHAAQKP